MCAGTGFPLSSLMRQHRMTPPISALIQHVYPGLQDAPSVLTVLAFESTGSSYIKLNLISPCFQYPKVRGLAKSLIFIDHDGQELQSKNKLIDAFQSKINQFEVGMVFCIVNYLLLQGYKLSQLVVLTPYLGQRTQEF